MSTNREFMTLFEASNLTQRRLSSILGVSTVTVNRWFVERGDSLDPPPYALQFLRAFVMLPEPARQNFPDYRKPPAEAAK